MAPKLVWFTLSTASLRTALWIFWRSGRRQLDAIGCWFVRAGCPLQPFHGTGIYFENGYESKGLAHTLELLMQRQNAFALPLNLGRYGLVQVPTPTEKGSAAAAASVKEICDRFGSVLAQPALA
jgi:hypothetical protein